MKIVTKLNNQWLELDAYLNSEITWGKPVLWATAVIVAISILSRWF